MEKKKMSKSDESEYSRINLKDTADTIIKKIKKAKSDSSNIPDNEKDLLTKPEALNLINIYSDINNSTIEKSLQEMKGKEYSFLKNKLAESLVEIICPIGKKINELMKDKSYLEKILKEGSEKARNIAKHNLKDIRNIVGLL